MVSTSFPSPWNWKYSKGNAKFRKLTVEYEEHRAILVLCLRELDVYELLRTSIRQQLPGTSIRNQHPAAAAGNRHPAAAAAGNHHPEPPSGSCCREPASGTNIRQQLLGTSIQQQLLDTGKFHVKFNLTLSEFEVLGKKCCFRSLQHLTDGNNNTKHR